MFNPLRLMCNCEFSNVSHFLNIIQKLPFGPVAEWQVGNTPENRKKNRFLNLRACEIFSCFPSICLCE